tara:strand:+ start:1606 stop:2589 length:984 start_codon:yes stop_codon:yes gene_type:complete
MTKKTQLIGISNAIVDVLTQVSLDFLEEIQAEPGSMNLINMEEANQLYLMLEETKEMSGGSVANTVSCFSNFGGKAGYIGQVHNDRFGEVFISDMKAMGVDVKLPPSNIGSPTARSHVLITDDGQRTMQTYLGACTELSSNDIDSSIIGGAEIILLEGYIWDIPDCNEIANKVIKEKNRSSVRVALSLSDSFCVERHFEAFRELTRDAVDIIFANEDEMMMLTRTETVENMIEASKKLGNLSVITLGEKGSIVVNKSDVIHAEALKTSNVVDTTGAGDTYTAAFLFGLLSNKSIQECTEMASWAASQVIQQIGARLDNETIEKCPLL